MDLSEFDEAASCVQDLINEYQQYQEMTADVEDLEVEEDDSLMAFDKQSMDSSSQGQLTTRPTSEMSHRTPSK
jgi:hypothetical protein